MKKIIVCLMLLILIRASINAMDGEQKSQCCGLDKTFYQIGKLFGRNDWLYLVYANSMWFLKKKIALKENLSDLDHYYIRYSQSANETVIQTYYTPLHEAIENGHLECVKLLCYAGADKNKKIKSSSDIQQEEKALEQYGYVHGSIGGMEPDRADAYIKKILESSLFGLSAIDLAEQLLKNQKEDDCVSLEQRKEIYNFLK